MNDVILLPNTKMTSVPRGAIREELHVRNLVASAVEIKGEMEEAEIRTMFENLFASKLPTVVGHKFQFVRAVGNRIMEPKVDRPWHGKMVKHISGQGPVYLRSAKNIETDFIWATEEDDSSSDSDAALTEMLDTRSPSPTQLSVENYFTAAAPATEPSASSNEAIDTLDNYRPPVEDHMNVHVAGTSSAFALPGVLCPTCQESFPPAEIEGHADFCCEQRSSLEERAYSNLMLTMHETAVPTVYEEGTAEVTNPAGVDLKDILKGIAARVEPKESRINVQRKFLWDDYLEARSRPWVHPENAIWVVFIGEPAVDDGGPRREFFTGVCKMSVLSFISDGNHSAC